MTLTAPQIETLRNIIGPKFPFDDLDLVVHKCFGRPRIHDVASRLEPANLVAKKCIALVEDEGMTLVFLRYLLLAPQCPPELSPAAVAIFPELATVERSFAEIVNAATGGIASN